MDNLLTPLASTTPLAKSILVSPIGIGAVKFGRTQALKYPTTPTTLASDEQLTTLLQTANELNVNLIDTAPAYGQSEQRIGQLMHKHNWFGNRDQWVIGTKFGEQFTETPDGQGKSTHNFNPESVIPSLKQSLTNLKTTHTEYTLIHANENDLHILTHQGTLQALADARAQGLTKAIGISTKTVQAALEAIRQGADLLMLTINQSEQQDAQAAAAAHAAGVGILIKKALQSGHALSPPPTPIPQSPPQTTHQSHHPLTTALKLALAAGLTNQPTKRIASSVIIGTTNPENLRTNANTARYILTSAQQE